MLSSRRAVAKTRHPRAANCLQRAWPVDFRSGELRNSREEDKKKLLEPYVPMPPSEQPVMRTTGCVILTRTSMVVLTTVMCGEGPDFGLNSLMHQIQ